ncbi:MAG: VCBS repeat-containing protein [Deltaproteobacteria bacterium]|nr:VCBS repeat-containing protein [Deltaproteobacteria bacterium]
MSFVSVEVGAQTGVSDDRVSLPEGPGSLEGVGENIDIVSNMGQMHYSVPIELPKGYGSLTPSLVLNYSSGGGGSVVGMGWSLEIPYIERRTVRGLPKYNRNDSFAYNGVEQLITIPNTEPPLLRSRFEKSFIRYRWYVNAEGREGYFTAEYPDGRIGYFGADANGKIIEQARVSGDTVTFRYHLVEMVDRLGHRVHYQYALSDNVALIQRIRWVFINNVPLYEATFIYEPRYDRLSDCKAGFNELLTERLSNIYVFAHGEQIRRYLLEYEDYNLSGGFTHLARIQIFGHENAAFPIDQKFSYSQSLGSLCDKYKNCNRPVVKSLGTLEGGVNIGTGDATLIDINGDALPDVLDTSRPGAPHRFYINTLAVDGTHKFSFPIESKLPNGHQGSHDLSSPYVQVLDADGDGHTDLINAQTGIVLRNKGTGDWSDAYSLWTAENSGLPDLAGDFDPSDGQLRTVRFIDYDNDKRIDLIRSEFASTANITTIYQNLGNGGFQSDYAVAAIGAGFESDSLELNDMNGDGLLDPVQVTMSEVRYRLNLGFGQWGPWIVIGGFTFFDQEAILAELEDLNGDGLADLVLVAGNEVHYWLNRNGEVFDARRVLKSEDVEGIIPERTNTNVLFADMNGNGSTDIVWIDLSGNVKFLEVFPVRPNLLTRIENGLGKVTQITYGISVVHLVRDGGPGAWKHPIPFAMTVVDRLEEWDALNPEIIQIIDYVYHDGFYDGKEKALRGYAKVEQYERGDENNEEAIALETYEVGDVDIYRRDLLLNREIRGANNRSIQMVTNTYDDCLIAQINQSNLENPVRNICKVKETTEYREGRPKEEWVTTSTRYRYDGFGNVIWQANDGIVSIGDQGCASCSDKDGVMPCGAQCLGDEAYTKTEYVLPINNNDLWIISKPIRIQNYGKADENGNLTTSFYSEETIYYDGSEFLGLELGQITNGVVTRVTERANSFNEVIHTQRNRLDKHGNIVESIDANGAVEGLDHRSTYVYDESGLRIIQTNIHLVDKVGPYQLRRNYAYDQTWDQVSLATNWMVVRDDVIVSEVYNNKFKYDNFGQLAVVIKPGDYDDLPGEQYFYEYGNPISRILVKRRSKAGGEQDIEHIICFDGHGRKFQEIDRLAENKYYVSGFTVYEPKGEVREIFYPYTSSESKCAITSPIGVESIKSEYDAVGRITKRIYPGDKGGEEYYQYLPVATVFYDREDTNPSSEHSGTPKIEYYDGLGRRTGIERYAAPTGPPLIHHFSYDELGNLNKWIDAANNQQVQKYDILGRIINVESKDRGLTQFFYDAAGNRIRTIDARGSETHSSYDGANRILEVWDNAAPDETRITYNYDTNDVCPKEICTNIAGKLVATTYPLESIRGGERFGYNSRGETVLAERIFGGHSLITQTNYDNAGRVISNKYPNGWEIRYVVDSMGRLVSIDEIINNIKYNGQGQINEIEAANKVVTEFQYDDNLRIINRKGVDAKGGAIVAYAYDRDRVGNILEIVDERVMSDEPLGNVQYKYDSLYRLLEADIEPNSLQYNEKMEFAYDLAGNIVLQTSSRNLESAAYVGQYLYDGPQPHAVTRAGNLIYTYDAAGNCITRGNDTYQWDFLGRLTDVKKAGKPIASYTYGASRERLIKREKTNTTYYYGQDFEVEDGIAKLYIKIGEDRVAKKIDADFATKILSDIAPVTLEGDSITLRPDGEITAGDAWIAQALNQNIYKLDNAIQISNVDELLASSAARLIAKAKDNITYLHTDHLGGIVATTDTSGKLIGRTEYFPYGMNRFETGDSESRFTGKERDKVSGLDYFGERYLDPWSGRWISPDPAFAVVTPKTLEGIEDIDEITVVYGYTHNNPINKVDRDGRIVLNILAGIGGFSVGLVTEYYQQKKAGKWNYDNNKTQESHHEQVNNNIKELLGAAFVKGFKAAFTNGMSIPTDFIEQLKNRQAQNDMLSPVNQLNAGLRMFINIINGNIMVIDNFVEFNTGASPIGEMTNQVKSRLDPKTNKKIDSIFKFFKRISNKIRSGKKKSKNDNKKDKGNKETNKKSMGEKQ